MDEQRMFATMRQMAWERAKGELSAMLRTYWDNQEKFENMNSELEAFIQKVEEDGLHE
jgi:hypothetical protein